MKSSFIMYYEWIDFISKMTDRQRGILLDAIYRYQVGEDEVSIRDPMVDMAFGFMKRQFNRDRIKYDKKVEDCRLAANIRWHKAVPKAYPDFNLIQKSQSDYDVYNDDTLNS